ncbi:MAG: glycoside hydrolase family 16 protein [Tannerellaceae bacterium]|jgi:beta-glucanase (GH16 family)|nr:glycoside hydrolase family 16 protein [Tannerellaceae bacterium]
MRSTSFPGKANCNVKKFVYLFICLILLFSCDRKVDKWELIWEDDFNQEKHFNESYWSKIPRGHSDWQNYMSDFDSLYRMQDGNLVLRGIVNKSLPQDTATFLTGGVWTKDKINFERGRVAIRAKLGGAQGAWPAIWMLPQNGTWPEGGEIDIMERLNSENIAYQTVHSYYTYTLGIRNPPTGVTATIDPAGYNVYAAELYADSICLFINNKHTMTYPRIETDKEGQFPFDQPQYLLIDMQLGGSWVGAVNPEDLPVEMWIDWVRYYKHE